MSDEEIRSHEILLENRHLAFIGLGVLMLCLGSFLLGQWMEHRRWVNPDAPLPHVAELTEHLPIEPAFPLEEAIRAGEHGGEDASPLPQPDRSPLEATRNAAALAPTNDPRAEKTRRPSTSDKDLYVQVLATRHEEAARRLRERLLGREYPATVISLPDRQGRILYRVRVGGYASRQEARQVASRLEKEERLKTWIP